MKKVLIVSAISLFIAGVFVPIRTASSDTVLNIKIPWKCPPDFASTDTTLPPKIQVGEHAGKRLYVHVEDSKGYDFEVYCSVNGVQYEHWASFPKAAAMKVDVCEYPEGRNDLNLTIAGNATNIVKTTDQTNKNMIFTVKSGTIKYYIHENYYRRRVKSLLARYIGRHHFTEQEGAKFHLIFDYKTKKKTEIRFKWEKVKRTLNGKEIEKYEWIQTSFVTEDENFPSPLSETSLATADAPCGTQPLTGLEVTELIFIPGFDFSPTLNLTQDPTRLVDFEAGVDHETLRDQYRLQNSNSFNIPTQVGGGAALTFTANDQTWAKLQSTLCQQPGVRSCQTDSCPEIQLPSPEGSRASSTLGLAALEAGADTFIGQVREGLPIFEAPAAEPVPPVIQLAALVVDTAILTGQIQDPQENEIAGATLGLFPEGDVADFVHGDPADDPDYWPAFVRSLWPEDRESASGGPFLIPISGDGTFRVGVRYQYDTDDPTGTESMSVVAVQSQSGTAGNGLTVIVSASPGQAQSGIPGLDQVPVLSPGQAQSGIPGLGQVPVLSPGQAQSGIPGLGQLPLLNWTLKVGAGWASTSAPIVIITPRMIRN